MASSRRPGGHSSSAIPSTFRTNWRCAVAVFVEFLVFRFFSRSAQTSGSAQAGQGKSTGKRCPLRAGGVSPSGWVGAGGLELFSLGGRGREGETSPASQTSLSSHVTVCDALRRSRSRHSAVRRAPDDFGFGSARTCASSSAIAASNASPVTPAAIRCFTAVAMTLTRPASRFRATMHVPRPISVGSRGQRSLCCPLRPGGRSRHT